MRTLIYDTRISRVILPTSGNVDLSLKYFKDWRDFRCMGLSLIGAWLSWDNTIHIYPSTAWNDFQSAVELADCVVSYNGVGFHDILLTRHAIWAWTDYDIAEEILRASGMHAGKKPSILEGCYSLANVGLINFEDCYGGDVYASCGLWWQTGQQWRVANDLVESLLLIKRLYENRHCLIDPLTGERLRLREPDWDYSYPMGVLN